MRERIGKDTQEGSILLCLSVYPLQSILVYEVAGVLTTILKIFITCRDGLMFDVFLQHIHYHVLIAKLLGVIAIQEIGIIRMRLELAYITIIAINASLVGQGSATASSAF